MKPSRFRQPPAVDARTGHLAWIVKFCLPVIAAGAICSACSGQNDAEKIRALIHNGAVLAEAHDIAGMLKLASADVRAMPMDLNRREIRAVLWQTFKYYGPISILYPRPDVEVNNDADEASAAFPFLILKKERRIPDLDQLRDDPAAWIEAIGKTADLYRLRLLLTKQDGDWFVKRAFLERFTGMGFEEQGPQPGVDGAAFFSRSK